MRADDKGPPRRVRYRIVLSVPLLHDGFMATIIIRNLDDVVADRLRLQARLKGVPVEQEARRVLTDATSLSRREIAARAAAIRARQPRHRSRAAALIREDRER